MQGKAPATPPLTSKEAQPVDHGALGPAEPVRNHVDPIVQIHMPSGWDNIEFLRLGRQLVGIFAEFDGMRLFAGDEQ